MWPETLASASTPWHSLLCSRQDRTRDFIGLSGPGNRHATLFFWRRQLIDWCECYAVWSLCCNIAERSFWTTVLPSSHRPAATEIWEVSPRPHNIQFNEILTSAAGISERGLAASCAHCSVWQLNLVTEIMSRFFAKIIWLLLYFHPPPKKKVRKHEKFEWIDFVWLRCQWVAKEMRWVCNEFSCTASTAGGLNP